VVISWLKDKVEALVELCVNGGRAVTVISNINLGEINFIRVLPTSGVTNFVVFNLGSHQFVAGPISNYVGLLKHDWRFGDS